MSSVLCKNDFGTHYSFEIQNKNNKSNETFNDSSRDFLGDGKYVCRLEREWDRVSPRVQVCVFQRSLVQIFQQVPVQFFQWDMALSSRQEQRLSSRLVWEPAEPLVRAQDMAEEFL